MNLDPFDIRRTRNSPISIIRLAAARAAVQITERAVETGINAIQKGKQTVEDNMSFALPKNVPSFSNPNRRALEDKYWGSAAGSTSSIASQFGSRGSQSLPMYKDKPYAYPTSQRARPIWRRKRVAIFVFVVISFLYYFGGFASHHETTTSKAPSWTWLKTPEPEKKVDWTKRSERVVEAFTLSWDAYERYAWGKILGCTTCWSSLANA
jgi:hypothetical protein